MDSITKSREALLKLFLDLGEELLVSGGEIERVEDSLSRLGNSFGAAKTDVFAITSSIVLTLSYDDGTAVTGTRRIKKGSDLNFSRLHALNALLRRCCQKSLSPEELEESFLAITREKPGRLSLYLGSAMAAGSFALFFGGTVWDGILAALVGLFICFLQRFFAPKCPNQVFFLFVSSFLCGCGIYLLGRVFSFLHPDYVVMGDIMLLIPGIAITVAVRDMVIGDTISGFTRLFECLLWAGALAGGFMLALILFGGVMG